MSFKDVRNRILDEYKMLFSAESMLKVCLSRSSRLWRTITSKSLANYVLRNKLRYTVQCLYLIWFLQFKLKILLEIRLGNNRRSQNRTRFCESYFGTWDWAESYLLLTSWVDKTGSWLFYTGNWSFSLIWNE